MTSMLKKAFHRAASLPETEQDAIARLVLAELEAAADRSVASDPFLAIHRNAPLDDEPLTDEDLTALREGLEDLAEGRIKSQEEIRRQLLK